MKIKGYIFDCWLKNGRRNIKIGYGQNSREARRSILALCEDVLKVTPNFVIIKPEAVC